MENEEKKGIVSEDELEKISGGTGGDAAKFLVDKYGMKPVAAASLVNRIFFSEKDERTEALNELGALMGGDGKALRAFNDAYNKKGSLAIKL